MPADLYLYNVITLGELAGAITENSPSSFDRVLQQLIVHAKENKLKNVEKTVDGMRRVFKKEFDRRKFKSVDFNKNCNLPLASAVEYLKTEGKEVPECLLSPGELELGKGNKSLKLENEMLKNELGALKAKQQNKDAEEGPALKVKVVGSLILLLASLYVGFIQTPWDDIGINIWLYFNV